MPSSGPKSPAPLDPAKCRLVMRQWLPRCPTVNGCIEWAGRVNRDGFGLVRWEGSNRMAHRVAFVDAWGFDPGAAIRQVCGNPACINFLHLLGGGYNPARDRWGDLCSITGCGGDVKALGLCSAHYQRQRVGKPLTPPVSRHPRHGMSVTDQLAQAVRAESGCLELPWRKGGYRPTINVTGKPEIAARVAYETWVAPTPEGLSVLHTCDNGCCIEPTHLYTGTAARNYADMVDRGRDRKARGEDSGTAQLTEQAVLDIRARWENGESQVSIAEQYAVSVTAVRSVINGWTWAHVTGGTPAVRRHETPLPAPAEPDDDWRPTPTEPAADPCSVGDCGRPCKTGGLCSGHAERLRRHGDVRADLPLRAKRSDGEPADAALARAVRSKVPAPYGLPIPCLILAGKARGGRAYVVHDGRPQPAARVAYQTWIGLIPDGLNVLHRCDVGACIERTHLYVGTQMQNVADTIARGRTRPAAGEAHFRSRLTENDVRLIRRRRAAGDTMAHIARDFGVAHGTIKAVIDRRTWAHVSDTP